MWIVPNIFIAIVVVLQNKLFPRLKFDSLPLLLMVTMLAGSAWSGVRALPCASNSDECRSTLLASIAIGGTFGMIFLLAGVNAVILAVSQKLFLRQIPLPCLVHYLFRALRRVEDAGAAWALPEYRSSIIGDLESAADVMQHQLFRRLRTDDRTIWAWRQDQARKIGNALRVRETWLITPTSTTRQDLLRDLSLMLVATLTGEWDKLPLADVPSLTPRQKYKWLIGLGRSALVAGFPIGLFSVLEHLQFITIASPASDYITGGLVVWAAISLLSALDPTLHEKITIAKEVLSFFGGSKKEKD